MLSTLLSASVFALAANSFLIPIDIIQDVRVSELAPLAPQSQTIRLDCSSCPFALSSERNGRHEWTNDVKSDLEMEFSVDGSSISLNGKPFYPINFPHIPPALSVKQIQKTNDGDTSAKKWEGYHKALTMSYSLEIDEKHFPENGADAIKIVMTIMGLEGQMIQVDAVEIKVLKQANGKVRAV